MITRTSTALLEGIKDCSDQSSWTEFDSRYRLLIMVVAKKLGLSEADSEDVAQETLAAFVQAYRSGQYNRKRGRLRDWLRGIARHKIRDIQRMQKRCEKLVNAQKNATHFISQAQEITLETLWEDECEKAVLRQSLEEVRQQVAPKTFESFQLFALEQWPARRVAKHLQVSEDTVYQSKRRILSRLRKILPQIKEIW